MATDPDTGTSNALLDSEIAVELTTAQQAPHVQYAPSGLHLGGGGGSYSFSPEEMQNVIDRWQAIVERANSQLRHIQNVAETTSAAADGASTSFTARVQTAGADLAASHQSMTTYATDYISRLKAAQQRYQDTEHVVTDGLSSAGEGSAQ